MGYVDGFGVPSACWAKQNALIRSSDNVILSVECKPAMLSSKGAKYEDPR